MTALHHAANNGDEELTMLLLIHNEGPHSTSPMSLDTVLLWAVNGYYHWALPQSPSNTQDPQPPFKMQAFGDVIQFLLNHGADPMAWTNTEEHWAPSTTTSFLFAIENGLPSTLELFLRWAQDRGGEDAVKKFLNMHHKIYSGMTPLHCALTSPSVLA